MASAVLPTVSVTLSTGLSVDLVAVSDGFGDAVVALGDGLAVPWSDPPRRPLSASPTPSGSSGSFVAVGDGEALGVVADASPAEFDVPLADEVAEGFGVAPSPWSEPLPLSPVVSLADGDGDFVAEADGSGDSLGSSERVTHGPGANGMSVASSASASLGVSPIPTKTAVGIAARAKALPAGMCSFVSSDFLGAA
jgi:hypothetical protein